MASALENSAQQGLVVEAAGPRDRHQRKCHRMPGGSCACFASCRVCARAQPGGCLADGMGCCLAYDLNCRISYILLFPGNTILHISKSRDGCKKQVAGISSLSKSLWRQHRTASHASSAV